MKGIRFFVGFSLFLAAGRPVQAQLMNIESRRMYTDSVRFVYKADIGFNYRDNDGARVFTASASSAFQGKTRDLRSIFLVLGSYEQVRSSSANLISNWFGHIRYNYKWNRVFRPEAFVQFQQNRPLLIDMRWLYGLGMRMKLLDNLKWKLYMGELYMYEKERSLYQGQLASENKHRSDTYLSASCFPTETLSLIETVYFQPALTDMSDYRLLNEFRLNLAASTHLNFHVSLRYYLDSQSPDGGSLYAFSTDFGLGMVF